jgi:hypothetical protein
MGESSEELLDSKDWVFLGMFRCERCGRSVTIRKTTRGPADDDERLFHRHRQCPEGCEPVRTTR